LEERDGELVALAADAIKRERKQAQGRAKGIEDLVRLGVQRNMRDPGGWAAHVAAARQGRKATHADKHAAREKAKEMRA